jgi:hypothetical protein
VDGLQVFPKPVSLTSASLTLWGQSTETSLVVLAPGGPGLFMASAKNSVEVEISDVTFVAPDDWAIRIEALRVRLRLTRVRFLGARGLAVRAAELDLVIDDCDIDSAISGILLEDMAGGPGNRVRVRGTRIASAEPLVINATGGIVRDVHIEVASTQVGTAVNTRVLGEWRFVRCTFEGAASAGISLGAEFTTPWDVQVIDCSACQSCRALVRAEASGTNAPFEDLWIESADHWGLDDDACVLDLAGALPHLPGSAFVRGPFLASSNTRVTGTHAGVLVLGDQASAAQLLTSDPWRPGGNLLRSTSFQDEGEWMLPPLSSPVTYTDPAFGEIDALWVGTSSKVTLRQTLPQPAAPEWWLDDGDHVFVLSVYAKLMSSWSHSSAGARAGLRLSVVGQEDRTLGGDARLGELTSTWRRYTAVAVLRSRADTVAVIAEIVAAPGVADVGVLLHSPQFEHGRVPTAFQPASVRVRSARQPQALALGPHTFGYTTALTAPSLTSDLLAGDRLYQIDNGSGDGECEGWIGDLNGTSLRFDPLGPAAVDLSCNDPSVGDGAPLLPVSSAPSPRSATDPVSFQVAGPRDRERLVDQVRRHVMSHTSRERQRARTVQSKPTP